MLKFFVIIAISIPLAARSLAGQDLTEPSLSEPSIAKQVLVPLLQVQIRLVMVNSLDQPPDLILV